MPSTFFGFEIGRRGLAASQLALDVISHNTTNVNTPGYSRQIVNAATTDPYTLPGREHFTPGQLGTGVSVASVTQVRDAFVDRRMQQALSKQGSLDNLARTLSQVEDAFSDPSSPGVGVLVQDFLHSFADLAANPESGPTRATVRNRAEAVAAGFRALDANLSAIGPELQARAEGVTRDINDYAEQIGSLNGQIHMALAIGDRPNDLLDKRALLLEKLSRLTEIQVSAGVRSDNGQLTGEINVTVGGFSLVQGEVVNPLPAATDPTASEPTLFTPSRIPIPVRGGELHGLIKSLNLVEGAKADVAALADAFLTRVNALHETGYGLDGGTGRALFEGTDATSIAVSSAARNSLDALAAASPPAPPNTPARGNGDNARALAALAHEPVIGSFSLNEFYNAKVSIIGADARAYATQRDTEERVLTQIQGLQSSVSGVSLDEELTKMLQYQRTYQAAARVLNVMDEAVAQIINELGAGR